MGMPKWWDTSAGAWGSIFIGVGLGIVLSLISPQIGIPVGVVITSFGIFLVVRAYRGKTKYRESKEKPQIDNVSSKPQEGSLDTVTIQDRYLILSWSIGMIITHGHRDERGLLADRASGIPLNKLMSMPCSECTEPRNKRGK